MISSRPLLSSLAASLALCALHASISAGVARPRRRIDFSRLNSLRLESPFESFAGGLLSVFVAMRPAPGFHAGRAGRIDRLDDDRIERIRMRRLRQATGG